MPAGIACAVAAGAVTVGACLPASSSRVQYSRTEYANPVVDADFADPAILRAADGWFYLYATQTDRARPDGRIDSLNVQVMRSRDLVLWQGHRDALPTKPAWASRTRDFWAPHVSHHDGTYYLYYSAKPDAALADTTRGLCLAVATSGTPYGPFVDKGEPLLCGRGFESIDPMQFDDPATGTPLLYWGSGFGPIRVQPLAPDRVSFAPGTSPTPLVAAAPRADSTRYDRLIEGAWVTYRAPWYYLFFSGDNCCGPRAHYGVMVARSRSATGPFEVRARSTGGPPRPILEAGGTWLAPGHNAVYHDGLGTDWLLYHAIDTRRPRARPMDGVNTRRAMLMDPIVYVDGWPTVEGGRPSSATRLGPAVRR